MLAVKLPGDFCQYPHAWLVSPRRLMSPAKSRRARTPPTSTRWFPRTRQLPASSSPLACAPSSVCPSSSPFCERLRPLHRGTCGAAKSDGDRAETQREEQRGTLDQLWACTGSATAALISSLQSLCTAAKGKQQQGAQQQEQRHMSTQQSASWGMSQRLPEAASPWRQQPMQIQAESSSQLQNLLPASTASCQQQQQQSTSSTEPQLQLQRSPSAVLSSSQPPLPLLQQYDDFEGVPIEVRNSILEVQRKDAIIELPKKAYALKVAIIEKIAGGLCYLLVCAAAATVLGISHLCLVLGSSGLNELMVRALPLLLLYGVVQIWSAVEGVLTPFIDFRLHLAQSTQRWGQGGVAVILRSSDPISLSVLLSQVQKVLLLQLQRVGKIVACAICVVAVVCPLMKVVFF